MRFFAKCEACRQKKIYIDKRTFSHKTTGEMKSQSEMCNKCYRTIKKMIV